MVYNKRPNKGFTLVELMLAMAFFTSILLVSTVVFVQMLNVYNKGIAVKQMNQFGRTLTDGLDRLGNSGSGIGYGTNSNSSTAPIRCLRVGSDTYVWSYGNETSSTADTYKYPDDNTPIPFSKLRNTDFFGRCPGPGLTEYAAGKPFISKDNLIQIMNSNVRVYYFSIKQPATTVGSPPITTNVNNLIKVKFVLGTYGGAGSVNNPIMSGALSDQPSCQAGNIGNFCAFGTYDSLLYLPNGF